MIWLYEEIDWIFDYAATNWYGYFIHMLDTQSWLTDPPPPYTKSIQAFCVLLKNQIQRNYPCKNLFNWAIYKDEWMDNASLYNFYLSLSVANEKHSIKQQQSMWKVRPGLWW